MAKGQPDFGAYAPTETIVGLSDMGELAARLGSIVTFDRRGNVVFLEDFEIGTVRWSTEGPVGALMGWSSNYARSGSFSYRIQTGATSGTNTYIVRKSGRPRLSTIGVEFSHTGGSNWWRLRLRVVLFDGTNYIDAHVYYDNTDGKLYLYDSSGVYTVIGTYQKPAYNGEFFTMKLVADFEAAKYKRLIANNQEIDLSAIAMYQHASTEAPALWTYIGLSPKLASAADVYIDDVIITQNEP